ncbi:unnamed protein product, partial [Medioppia subpectinata]
KFEDKESCLKDTSFGALVDGLVQYLSSVAIKRQINTDIIAFNIENKSHVFTDETNVRISLKHKNQLVLGDSVECVFWDFTQNKWSSEGCRLIESESNRETTVCECNHLTNFAALMDTSGRETDDETKNILTLICCSVSSTLC